MLPVPSPGPYEAALGARVSELHPQLRRYFSAIPVGYIGIGRGVFSTFGATRHWLRPVFVTFERRHALFAGHASEVPFCIVNRSIALSDETVAATARRELELPGGTWTMSDTVLAVGARVVDHIGDPWSISASFDVTVAEGALLLRSRAIGIVWSRVRMRVPRFIAPVIRLREAYDPEQQLQRVELTVDAAVIGRIYEYRGSFTYEIVRETESA